MTDPMTLAFVTALNVMGLSDDAHEAARMVNEGAPEAAMIEQEIIGTALLLAQELRETFDEIITRDSESIYFPQYRHQNVEYAQRCAVVVEKLTALLR
jgi:ribosomal protein L17